MVSGNGSNYAVVGATVANSKRAKASGSTAGLTITSEYNLIELKFKTEFPDDTEATLKSISRLEKLLGNMRKAIKKEARVRQKLSYKHIEDSEIKVS